MGMFSFAKDIGDKIFNRDDDKHDAKKKKLKQTLIPQ